MNRFNRNGLRCLVSIALLMVAATWISAAEPSCFTVVLLPDTQFYSESHPQTYVAQTQWIKDHAQSENIRFAIHLGDVVNRFGVQQQWENADRAHAVLDGVVPYSITPGNHDLDRNGDVMTRGTTRFNKYFSPTRFKDRDWYGGHLGQGNENNFCFFEANGMRFMVVSLEYSPTDAMLQWAGRVIEEHPQDHVIVATHCYMRPDGRDTKCSKTKELVGNCGEMIWQKLIRKHPNIFMVVSGHVIGTGHQTSTNEAGKPVHEILVDYQGLPNGGDGWLALMRFKPDENKIAIEAYSPLLDKSKSSPADTYTLQYNIAPAVPVGAQ